MLRKCGISGINVVDCGELWYMVEKCDIWWGNRADCEGKNVSSGIAWRNCVDP